MNTHLANAMKRWVLTPLELLSIVVLIGATAGLGLYAHSTLVKVRRELPAEMIRQVSDLTLLVQALADVVHAAELAVLEPMPGRRDTLIMRNSALRERLAAIRASYEFNNLVGAAAIHALVNPASEDIQRWLMQGLPGFASDSPTIMRIVETRARDALTRARDLSLQGSSTALGLLNQGAVRLEAFRGWMLIMLALLITLALLVIGLFRGRQQAAARLATVREQLADAIENISEGFILYDAEDRVVVCNEEYRRMYAKVRDLAVPGTPFIKLARAFSQTHLVVGAEAREDEVLAKRIAHHSRPGKPCEYELKDARRIRITERRTREGGIVAIHADMTDVRQTQERLRHLATHDPLTGLPNRAYCQERMEQIIDQARRDRRRFAVLYLDLDRFKAINDTLGHHAGDELLQAVARRLQRQLRDENAVARLGGDEFVVTLEDLGNVPCAEVLAKRFISALSNPFRISGHELFVSTSIGIAHFPEDGEDIATLMGNADAASYRAKSQGLNNYCLYAIERKDSRETESGGPLVAATAHGVRS